MIEEYSFGRMVVAGKVYTSDLILFPDRIKDSWWRQSGHRLVLKDMEDVFTEELEMLVIGTGSYGVMKVDEEVQRCARSKGITLIIEKTEKAVERYNAIFFRKKTIGAFHLTC